MRFEEQSRCLARRSSRRRRCAPSAATTTPSTDFLSPFFLRSEKTVPVRASGSNCGGWLIRHGQKKGSIQKSSNYEIDIIEIDI